MEMLKEFINKLIYQVEIEETECEQDTINCNIDYKLKETVEFKMMLQNTIIM